jgi:hypothetical protein
MSDLNRVKKKPLPSALVIGAMDEWFIRYVNQRGQEAGEDRKAGENL